MPAFSTILLYLQYTALTVCYIILLGYFFMHRQWQLAIVSLLFLPACGGGFLIALIIGWQEANAWKIKKLMIVYTVLFVTSAYTGGKNMAYDMMHPKEEVPAKGKKAKAPPITR